MSTSFWSVRNVYILSNDVHCIFFVNKCPPDNLCKVFITTFHGLWPSFNFVFLHANSKSFFICYYFFILFEGILTCIILLYSKLLLLLLTKIFSLVLSPWDCNDMVITIFSLKARDCPYLRASDSDIHDLWLYQQKYPSKVLIFSYLFPREWEEMLQRERVLILFANKNPNAFFSFYCFRERESISNVTFFELRR